MPFNPVFGSTCVNKNSTSSRNYVRGLFFAEHNVEYLIKLFPVQISFMALLQGLLQFVITPLGLTPIVAQITAGILLGPSGLGLFANVNSTFFPRDSFYLPSVVGMFGCMIHFFLIGVKLDLNIIMNSSKKERAIGILTFIIPIMLTAPTSYLLKKCAPTDVEKNLHVVGFLESTTSFHVIASFLADLKILNTELGRIASSASTISGICSWVAMVVASAIKKNGSDTWIPYAISVIGQVLFITVLLRKVVKWFIKKTPQGEPIQETYLLSIFLMILGTGLVGEVLGQHFFFGPMILGLSIPNGPPVGSSLVDKLESFVFGLMLPPYFFYIGCLVNYSFDLTRTWWIVLLLSSLSIFGKIMGTIIPCLLFGLPFRESIILGLILSNLGLFDIQAYTTAYTLETIDDESYKFMVANVALVAGVIAPTVRLLYDPSRRYKVHKGRTIQNARKNDEIRMLICIYNEDHVLTTINILEASNPTKESPIGIYVLHLVELLGRSTPLLLSHKHNKNLFDGSSPSDRIINGFKIYEKRNSGTVLLQPFTAMTPFVSAHDDICTMALERRTSLIIIPYHRKWNIDGTTEPCKWMTANKKVLKQAPCSVGILVDRQDSKQGRSVISSRSNYNVGVIFLGDADDREAVCYAIRMAGHPNVNLTVHRMILNDNAASNVAEKMLDNNVLNEYKLHNMDSEGNNYIEEAVRDVVQMITRMRTLENVYDIILVGRRHDTYSSLLSGFRDWSDHPELGFFGDILVSADFRGNFSLLIVQQHYNQQM